MKPGIIRLKLKSAATFGTGDGLAGLVDVEIEHDRHGFPFMRGRTLKGLLNESAENVLYALGLHKHDKKKWSAVKDTLFGKTGPGLKEQAHLHIGDACLPKRLQHILIHELYKNNPSLTPDDILYSLTGIRRQTAVNPEGAPDHASLRAMRVLLKGTVLESHLTFQKEPSSNALALLVAAVMDFRRAGTARNRGRGWLHAELDDEKTTRNLFDIFVKVVNP